MGDCETLERRGTRPIRFAAAERFAGRAVAISPDGAFKYLALYSRYLNGSD